MVGKWGYISHFPVRVRKHLTKAASGRKGVFGLTDRGTAYHGGKGARRLALAHPVRKQGATTVATHLAFLLFDAPERRCRCAGWVSCLS